MRKFYKNYNGLLLVLFIIVLQVNLTAQQVTNLAEELPWQVPVKGFSQLHPCEHPRLLFRKSDLPALKKKAATKQGKAMLARLRYLLDGRNGDSLPLYYNSAKTAYTLGPNKNLVVDSAGVYTFGHVAGYGLLYQLTGEKQ